MGGEEEKRASERFQSAPHRADCPGACHHECCGHLLALDAVCAAYRIYTQCPKGAGNLSLIQPLTLTCCSCQVCFPVSSPELAKLSSEHQSLTVSQGLPASACLPNSAFPALHSHPLGWSCRCDKSGVLVLGPLQLDLQCAALCSPLVICLCPASVRTEPLLLCFRPCPRGYKDKAWSLSSLHTP